VFIYGVYKIEKIKASAVINGVVVSDDDIVSSMLVVEKPLI
jgi:hypothetical protein